MESEGGTVMVEDDAALPLAATVVLLRDAKDGPEVLLLERPSDRGSFAGAWVFPGGRVDPEDGTGELAGAANAAVRELAEETGLRLDRDALVPMSLWIPPVGIPKRLRTWFFYAKSPDGTVTLNAEEAVSSLWLRPADALERHGHGDLLLVPPTWVTLHGLLGVETADAAIEHARITDPRRYTTRRSGGTMLWHPDVAWEDVSLLDAAGTRHRLQIERLPWVYSRTPDGVITKNDAEAPARRTPSN